MQPNKVHQADLLLLQHCRVGSKTYKYALTVVDVASRYKEAQAITDKTATHVAKALQFIYLRSPLTCPKLLQVDPGSEFRGAVKNLCDQHGIVIPLGVVGGHRDQGMVEGFNLTLAERLFGCQYHWELAEPGTRKKRLGFTFTWSYLEALNDEVTCFTGKKPP